MILNYGVSVISRSKVMSRLCAQNCFKMHSKLPKSIVEVWHRLMGIKIISRLYTDPIPSHINTSLTCDFWGQGPLRARSWSCYGHALWRNKGCHDRYRVSSCWYMTLTWPIWPWDDLDPLKLRSHFNNIMLFWKHRNYFGSFLGIWPCHDLEMTLTLLVKVRHIHGPSKVTIL